MITIHPLPGQQMSDLARTLIALSSTEEPARSATSGITVTEAVALEYLTELLAPTVPVELPAGQAPVSARLSAVVRSAETRSGIVRPPSTTVTDSIPKARPRKRVGSLARTTEEALNG